MTIHTPLRALLCLLFLGATISHPAHAVKLMDLRAEQLLIGADSLRQDLALSPNQQTLWQQSASRAQALLRTRQLRRDRLQARMKAALASGSADLRELNVLVEAEEAATQVEDRQLREHWLAVNDGLTDAQRSQVAALLLSQLERVDADPARPQGRGHDGSKGERGGKEGGPPGGRGQRPGGMGGMGGIGG